MVNAEAAQTAPFEVLGAGKPPHERIGYSLAGLLQQSVYRALTSQPGLAVVVSPAFKVAREILRASAPGALRSDDARVATLEVLHELIDGELDVDRSDYLLRDARAYGFDYVSFDLGRLVDNVAVAETEGGGLTLVVRAQGQPAAESFLFARFRMYQWGVFHHKVVQVSAALQHLTSRLLRGATSGDHPQHRFFRDIALLGDESAADSERRQALERLPLYDDVWWMGRLRDMPQDPWRDLVLYRRKGPSSLWKRTSAFPLDSAGLVDLNGRLPRRGENERQKAWDAVVDAIEQEDGILVSRAVFTPYRTVGSDDPASSLRVLVGEDRLVPLSQLSSLVATLNDAWMNELQVFASSPAAVDNQDVPLHVAERIRDALPPR